MNNRFLKNRERTSIRIKIHWLILLSPAMFLPIYLENSIPLSEALLKSIKSALVLQIFAILPHELGHLALCLMCNIKRGTLLFGGFFGAWCPDDENAFSRLTPVTRLFLFVSGPAANLLMASICSAIIYAFPNYLNDHFPLLVKQAKIFNILMSILNLLPVYPLDGGRILREIFILSGLEPPKILRGMRIAAAVFGCGFFLVILQDGYWLDLLVCLLICGVSLLSLSDAECILYGLNKG